ncbi:MAG TPA: iron uptake transporter permease EfeU [Pseudolysinimonas sp.]
MLATLVIGLREGLEAALIVGIIAAFLRRNGKSLVPMWIGVIAALIASVAVGIVLTVVESALPQSAQEGMESIIGVVAIGFVTSMIIWMQHHARGMRRELEAEATHALHEGTAWALAGMAFLAVLKEGFETSVFLLATFQAATDAGLAGLGAVLGIAAAVVIGIGIYAGGIRIDLGRFFRYTGIFLLLVAAGLVISALRTAHEAGWLEAGQQRTVDLSWLAPAGSVQAALITGVLGIPADPRLIEVVGWFAYLIPMALFLFWPLRHRPSARAVPRLQLGVAAGLAVIAIALAVVAPLVLRPTGAELALDGGGAARLDRAASTLTVDREAIPLTAPRQTSAGTTSWTVDRVTASDGPATLTLAGLTTAAGGTVPVGLDPQRAPGPFEARWSVSTKRTVIADGAALLDAHQAQTRIVTISGGGLSSPRTFTVSGGSDWSASDAAVTAASAAGRAAGTEARLWGLQVPAALLIAAVVLGLLAIRSIRRARDASETTSASLPTTAQNRTHSYATH